jgi:hypothetical protein
MKDVGFNNFCAKIQKNPIIRPFLSEKSSSLGISHFLLGEILFRVDGFCLILQREIFKMFGL